MVTAIPCENLMLSTKYEGLGYPANFLKSRGSDIRNNIFEHRTEQINIFRDEMLLTYFGYKESRTLTQLEYFVFL